MKFIDSPHSQLLTRAMDTYTLRQRVTAANIANADTPGYAKRSVTFEDELQKVQKSGGAEKMSNVTPKIIESGEEVVLEDELLEMSDTQIRVHLVTRSIRHNFDMLRNGITGINR